MRIAAAAAFGSWVLSAACTTSPGGLQTASSEPSAEQINSPQASAPHSNDAAPKPGSPLSSARSPISSAEISSAASSAVNPAADPSAGFGGGDKPPQPGSAEKITNSAPPTIPRGRVPLGLTESPPLALLRKAEGPIDPSRDGAWLRRLARSEIIRASQNRGGSTITIRLELEDGYQAVFKPEQRGNATNFRSEIAAFHVDRLLGFNRTAPVLGRALPILGLRRLLEYSGAPHEYLERVSAEVSPHPQNPKLVRGALIAWHEEPLRPLDMTRAGLLKQLATYPPDENRAESKLSRSLTELVLFDYLIDNTDRWSGGNILRLGEGGPVIFLDNAAGFSSFRVKQGLSPRDELSPHCNFPKEIIERLRHAGPHKPEAYRFGELLRRSLRRDPLTPILDRAHFAAIDRRIEELFEHLESCEAKRDEKVNSTELEAP